MITYVISSNVSPYYKIGKTNNIDRRLNQLRGSMSFVCFDLIRNFNGDYENLLHEYFHCKRVSGEWFNLDANDLIKLKSFPDDLSKCYIDYSSSEYNLDNILSISKVAKDLFLYILINIDENKTIFCLDKYSFMREFNVRLVQTYNKAFNELIDSKIIAKTNNALWIYVNPFYIYKGDLAKLIKKVKTK